MIICYRFVGMLTTCKDPAGHHNLLQVPIPGHMSDTLPGIRRQIGYR